MSSKSLSILLSLALCPNILTSWPLTDNSGIEEYAGVCHLVYKHSKIGLAQTKPPSSQPLTKVVKYLHLVRFRFVATDKSKWDESVFLVGTH